MTGGAQDSGVAHGTCRKCGFDLALAPGIDTYCPNPVCGSPMAEMRAAIRANGEARERAEYERLKAKFDTRATPTPAGWQHVAYFDEGAFHWMSGIAPRDCELYARIPTAPAEGGV